MVRVFVVTGAAKGLGLAWIELLSSNPSNKVFAIVRKTSQRLLELESEKKGQVFIVKADVAQEEDIFEAVREVERNTDHVDVLINNAGVAPSGVGNADPFSTIKMENIMEAVRVNVLGPIMTTKAFVPLLRRGTEKKVISSGSTLGSLKLVATKDFGNGVGTTGDYSISKAALHMAMRKMDMEYKKEGFSIISLHPGFVKTDMAGTDAPPLYPHESVEKQLAIIDNLLPEATDNLFAIDLPGLP
ncbi:NAD(P)-binding protein, partial [Atractiella rhizophila]